MMTTELHIEIHRVRRDDGDDINGDMSFIMDMLTEKLRNNGYTYISTMVTPSIKPINE